MTDGIIDTLGIIPLGKTGVSTTMLRKSIQLQ